MASGAEEVLVRVAAALSGKTDAGSRIERGRADPFDQAELPAINVRRVSTATEAWAQGLDQVVIVFELDCEVRGLDWETTADALHEQADVALKTDEQLRQMLKGFRCISTECTGEAGDGTAGRLTARYSGRFIQRAG